MNKKYQDLHIRGFIELYWTVSRLEKKGLFLSFNLFFTCSCMEYIIFPLNESWTDNWINLRQNFKNMIYLLTKILTKEKAEGYVILNYLIITRQHINTMWGSWSRKKVDVQYKMHVK